MTRRFLAALITVLALTFALFSSPSTARADGESNEVGACLAAGEVWLLVVTDSDEVLANECVGTPATGTDALVAAGLELGRDGDNFICSIGGHPAQCPAVFAGQYWGSYMGAPGAEYAYAQLGPDENEPQAGTIEAWCYNKADEAECTPPYLTIVQDGQEIAAPAGVTTQDLPVTGTSDATDPAEQDDAQSVGLPWVWIFVAIAVAAGAGVTMYVARKKAGKGDAVGGR